MRSQRFLQPALVAGAAAAAFSGGCVSSGTYAPELDEAVSPPNDYGEQPVERSIPFDGWCSDFGDATLEGLVDKALEQNLNLRSAWARLAQSQAVARQQGAGVWPQVDLSGGASRSKVQGPAQAPQFGGATVNQYNAQVGVSYEIDLWGRVAAGQQAANYDALAARADAEAAAVSVTAQVAEAWFDVVHQRQRRDLIQAQIDVNTRYLELLRLRLEQGQASGLDITQQEQQIEGLKGQLEQVTSLELTAHKRLAVLLGLAPSTEVAGAANTLPDLPPSPQAGLPVDLLVRRPDVRAAKYRLEAADRRIAVAIANRLPALRLSANLSLQAFELQKLFDDVFWSIAANASMPLVDGGRLGAAVDSARAASRAELFTYAQSLMTAIQEVETALVNERQQAAFLQRLQTQVDKASQSLDLARDRYRQGAGDYLRVLSAIQALQQAEQQYLDAQRNQLSFRLQLCRALGGDWTQELTPTDKLDDDDDDDDATTSSSQPPSTRSSSTP